MAARTNRGYNLHLVDASDCGSDGWPTLEPCQVIPDRLVGFNEVATYTGETVGVGIHFFLDDYQFERVWTRPEQYVDRLARFECVMSPDFSTFTDMPEPMQRWNIYRSRALAHFWQQCGLQVIPTLQWAGEDSLSWCFDGLPRGGVVALSTLGVRRDPFASARWLAGAEAAVAAIEPSEILHYSTKLDGWERGREFANAVVDRFDQLRKVA